MEPENKQEKNIRIKVRGVILYEGKLLAVRHPETMDFLALPGGHLEWGEGLKECLEREIIEELGMKPTLGRLLYINNFIDKKNTHYFEFFFEITNGSEFKDTAHLAKTHVHEIAEVVWLNKNDAASLRPHGIWEDFVSGEILLDIIRYI